MRSSAVGDEQVEAFKEQVDEAIEKAQKMLDRGEL